MPGLDRGSRFLVSFAPCCQTGQPAGIHGSGLTETFRVMGESYGFSNPPGSPLTVNMPRPTSQTHREKKI